MPKKLRQYFKKMIYYKNAPINTELDLIAKFKLIIRCIFCEI